MDIIKSTNKKIILGMVIIAISALMLGSVIGFFVTREVLKTQVLNQMIMEGYVDTNLATATSEDIIYGKSAYVKGELVNGSAILFDTSDATATSDVILQGKTAYVDGQLVIGTLPIISGQTINPSASATTITAAAFLKEDIIIKGDSNLISSNIRKGVKIFNIIGSYEGENNNED